MINLETLTKSCECVEVVLFYYIFLPFLFVGSQFNQHSKKKHSRKLLLHTIFFYYYYFYFRPI